jgi:hypothetical protein
VPWPLSVFYWLLGGTCQDLLFLRRRPPVPEAELPHLRSSPGQGKSSGAS